MLILCQKSCFLGTTIFEVPNRIDIKYIAYYHLHYKIEQLQEWILYTIWSKASFLSD